MTELDRQRIRERVRKNTRLIRFNDLTWEDINCDLHVHTTRTDGAGDMKTLLGLARKRRIRRLAFTDHVRSETDWFPEFAAEVRSLRGGHRDVTILVGCEAKALDTSGSLDATDAILAECDIVLGSVHRMPKTTDKYFDPDSMSKSEFMDLELQHALGLIEAAPINVLAHPCGMYLRKHGEYPEGAMRAILRHGIEHEVPVEINTSYLGGLFGRHLKLCAEINPFVSVGSDVHQVDNLGDCRDQLRLAGIAAP